MEDEANVVESLFSDLPKNSPYDLEISYSNPQLQDICVVIVHRIVTLFCHVTMPPIQDFYA